MHCVVTAGPSYEDLDQVRRMTNFSSGTLGTLLADRLAQRGHQVTLLRGHYATHPRPVAAQRVAVFTTAADLARQLQDLAAQNIGAVFHAAAVCDFRFGRVWQRDAAGSLNAVAAGKIRTDAPGLLVELVPTPKLIEDLRDWFPAARLVGWKYEVEGDRAAVVRLAREQIARCRTHACVANGPAYGTGYGMVTRSGPETHCADLNALFDALEPFTS